MRQSKSGTLDIDKGLLYWSDFRLGFGMPFLPCSTTWKMFRQFPTFHFKMSISPCFELHRGPSKMEIWYFDAHQACNAWVSLVFSQLSKLGFDLSQLLVSSPTDKDCPTALIKPALQCVCVRLSDFLLHNQIFQLPPHPNIPAYFGWMKWNFEPKFFLQLGDI